MFNALAVLAAATALTAVAAFPALAQGSGRDMPGMAAPAGGAESAMMGAMDRMSKDMAAVPMTGDADRDFVGMMIPHHQGAIDMAEFELAHGKDPGLRRLARQIVAAQRGEIAVMRQWQAKHPPR